MERPQVSVYNAKTGEESSQLALPDVFQAPIRPDIVQRLNNFFVQRTRQPYAVHYYAGHQHSAESWGTGRAVSRIPRVSGGGTHRAGQGAFGNMCRKGRMFSPTRTWRRWMHVIKKNEKRYATVSAIAASSITPLIQARGHSVQNVKQVPLVVTDDVESIVKTKDAVRFLKTHGLYADAKRAKDSKTKRVGRGKSRNRRHVMKKGPLIVYKNAKPLGLKLAFRNIPSVDTINVDRLALTQLAPGGHVGRLIVWTESAFNELNERFGSYNNEKAQSKFNFRSGATYHLPRPIVTNSDVKSIAESDAVANVLRPKQTPPRRRRRYMTKKGNPLRNFKLMTKLNPYQEKKKRLSLLRNRREKLGIAKPRPKSFYKGREKFYSSVFSDKQQ